MNTTSTECHDVPLSQSAQRAAGQAISFLMQQAVENADCISLAAGLVDEATLPVQLIREATARLLAVEETGRRVLQYGITPGPAGARSVIRDFLGRLEKSVDGLSGLPLDRIVLTTGSQQLLNLTAQALFNAGDICLVAAPTYFVFLGVLEAVGADVRPVRSDADGMCPDDLDRVLNELSNAGELHRVRMVYAVSYFDNPSGISISADRRPRLLSVVRKWSTEHRILILEDAAYRELLYDNERDAAPSIWSFDEDHETVILAQTFSKSFSPGVRVGFGVLPSSLVKAVNDLKGNDDFGSPFLNQSLLADVLRSGEYDRHLETVRCGYGVKCEAMLAAADEHFSDIPNVSWVRPAGGLYVWMTLPESIQTGFDSPLFYQATQVEKVMYVPGELSYPASWPQRPRNQMRLSFGVQSVAGIHEGIRRLAAAVRHVIR